MVLAGKPPHIQPVLARNCVGDGISGIRSPEYQRHVRSWSCGNARDRFVAALASRTGRACPIVVPAASGVRYLGQQGDCGGGARDGAPCRHRGRDHHSARGPCRQRATAGHPGYLRGSIFGFVCGPVLPRWATRPRPRARLCSLRRPFARRPSRLSPPAMRSSPARLPPARRSPPANLQPIVPRRSS